MMPPIALDGDTAMATQVFVTYQGSGSDPALSHSCGTLPAMARPLLKEFPRALCPVTSRNNSRAAIYLNDPHGEVFLNLDILDAITGYPYDKGMEFEWHVAKAGENVRKHGVDFPTATRVFLDPH